ncbi:protein of unknown function [Brevefilum fermentans]|uniref:Uncharacterized protein n=1 Tax=Candidatus Brevifilum fermentans TaxID=1986204 RepID=A0A1Y6K907_9CHLR|nr:protein of unknown function [Brevefilum fermentans]
MLLMLFVAILSIFSCDKEYFSKKLGA